MKEIRCDKCGAIIPQHYGNYEYENLSLFHHTVNKEAEIRHRWAKTRVDLCEDCIEEFKRIFIRGKKVNV